MKINRFEDMIAWKKAQDLAVAIYQAFNNSKDMGFKYQIFRASVSISNNIAEGFERGSSKDFKRFLFISKGSCSEVKSMVYLAAKLGYLESTAAGSLIESCEEISKMLRGFIRYLERPHPQNNS